MVEVKKNRLILKYKPVFFDSTTGAFTRPKCRFLSSIGYTTITQLIDVACEDLKRKLSQERRAQWRQEAHKEYAKSNTKYLWESVDGEDFD